MSEISALWERIEHWLEAHGERRQLRPPATEGQLAEAEARLGFALPNDLRESLLRHDGVKPDSWPDFYPRQLANIVSDSTEGRELWGELPAGTEQFLLVADGGDGSFLALTLGPQADGKLYFFEGCFEGVMFESWQARLADVADGLEAGRYVLRDEEFTITERENGSHVVGGPNPVSYRGLVEL